MFVLLLLFVLLLCVVVPTVCVAFAAVVSCCCFQIAGCWGANLPVFHFQNALMILLLFASLYGLYRLLLLLAVCCFLGRHPLNNPPLPKCLHCNCCFFVRFLPCFLLLDAVCCFFSCVRCFCFCCCFLAVVFDAFAVCCVAVFVAFYAAFAAG